MLVLEVLKATLNHRLFVDRASVDELFLPSLGRSAP